MSDAEVEAYRAPILAKYEEEGSPYYSTARLWDDGVIDPRDTRDVLGLCWPQPETLPLQRRDTVFSGCEVQLKIQFSN